MERQEVIIGDHRYELARLKGGSARYGSCEVCGKHCDTTYRQSESRFYNFGEEEGDSGWTHHNCRDLFGHKECLEGARKTVTES